MEPRQLLLLRLRALQQETQCAIDLAAKTSDLLLRKRAEESAIIGVEEASLADQSSSEEGASCYTEQVDVLVARLRSELASVPPVASIKSPPIDVPRLAVVCQQRIHIMPTTRSLRLESKVTRPINHIMSPLESKRYQVAASAIRSERYRTIHIKEVKAKVILDERQARLRTLLAERTCQIPTREPIFRVSLV